MAILRSLTQRICTHAPLQERQAEGQLFKGFFEKAAGERLYEDAQPAAATTAGGSTQQQQQKQQRGWAVGLAAAAVALMAALLASPLLRAVGR